MQIKCIHYLRSVGCQLSIAYQISNLCESTEWQHILLLPYLFVWIEVKRTHYSKHNWIHLRQSIECNVVRVTPPGC